MNCIYMSAASSICLTTHCERKKCLKYETRLTGSHQKRNSRAKQKLLHQVAGSRVHTRPKELYLVLSVSLHARVRAPHSDGSVVTDFACRLARQGSSPLLH